MKTTLIISIILSILLFGKVCTVNVQAMEPMKTYPLHAQQVKKVLEETVQFPGCAMNKVQYGEAVVLFSIDLDGKIQIDEISANCKALEQNLREQLKDLYFEGVIHPYNQHYKVKFTFLFC